MLIRQLPQGQKPTFFSGLRGTLRLALRSLRAGSKAEAVRFPRRFLQFLSQFLLSVLWLFAVAALCVPGMAQNPSDSGATEAKPKADIIFEHGNVYSGVPANAQFSSILREEAIALRGDRILAVGKNADMEQAERAADSGHRPGRPFRHARL